MTTERTEIDKLETKLDKQFDKMDSKLDRLDSKIDSKIDNLRSDLKGDMRWFSTVTVSLITLVITIGLFVLGYLIKHP